MNKQFLLDSNSSRNWGQLNYRLIKHFISLQFINEIIAFA
jgi:hypothetical protein